MATIYLQDNHRITSDSRQWIIQKRGKDTVDDGGVRHEFWKSIGYYPTLEGVALGAYQMFLRQSDAVGIDEFMTDSKRIFNKTVSCLSPVMDIKEK